MAEEGDCRVVCEYHEDWAVVLGDAVELVSAKRRDTAKRACPAISQLAGSGGTRDLAARW